MSVCRRICTPLFVIVAMASIHVVQLRLDDIREDVSNEELLYFPNDKILTHFTAGMSGPVADFLWLRTIQYMGQEFDNQDTKFEWLEHMCNTVTNLDPHFEGAYVYGGALMASIANDEGAYEFLRKGMHDNPESSEIAYELAKIYVLNRRKEPAAPSLAAHYLRMVGERHETPEAYLQWARRIEEENNLTGDAKAVWADMAQHSPSDVIRKLARKNLELLVAQESVDTLRRIAAGYRAETGAAPKDWHDLVRAGYLDEVPAKTELNEYYIDINGQVQSTLLQDDLTHRTLNGMQSYVVHFEEEHGRKPASLDEIRSYLEGRLPAHPVAGQEWHYDPETGRFY